MRMKNCFANKALGYHFAPTLPMAGPHVAQVAHKRKEAA